MTGLTTQKAHTKRRPCHGLSFKQSPLGGSLKAGCTFLSSSYRNQLGSPPTKNQTQWLKCSKNAQMHLTFTKIGTSQNRKIICSCKLILKVYLLSRVASLECSQHQLSQIKWSQCSAPMVILAMRNVTGKGESLNQFDTGSVLPLNVVLT